MKSRLNLCLLGIGFLVLSTGCQPEKEETNLDVRLHQLLHSHSGGEGRSFYELPSSENISQIPQDPNNKITHQKVQLGQMLFFETGMGTNSKFDNSMQTFSCGSCHNVGKGMQSGLRQGIADGGMGFGIAGEARIKNPDCASDSVDVQPIRTPAALNIDFVKNTLWDGRLGAGTNNIGTQSVWEAKGVLDVNSLGFQGPESQGIAGIKAHRMNPEELQALDDYTRLFSKAFPDVDEEERMTRVNAGLAIASYERTVLSNQAPFQKWLQGNPYSLTEEQKLGAVLFFGKANCVACHNGPALNSNTFHALGMGDLIGGDVLQENLGVDQHRGRGGFTGQEEDMFRFKTPQLYNLKDIDFLGHGGTFNSVREMIEYKNAGLPENSNVQQNQLDELFRPLHLNTSEIEQLADFIENGLYDPNLERYLPGSLPSGNCFPNNDPVSKEDLGCN